MKTLVEKMSIFKSVVFNNASLNPKTKNEADLSHYCWRLLSMGSSPTVDPVGITQ